MGRSTHEHGVPGRSHPPPLPPARPPPMASRPNLKPAARQARPRADSPPRRQPPAAGCAPRRARARARRAGEGGAARGGAVRRGRGGGSGWGRGGRLRRRAAGLWRMCAQKSTVEKKIKSHSTAVAESVPHTPQTPLLLWGSRGMSPGAVDSSGKLNMQYVSRTCEVISRSEVPFGTP